MAAGYNSLLRTLCTFLLFSSLACFYCQQKSIFKDLKYSRLLAGFWSLVHPTPDNFKCFYFNVRLHFKRRPPRFITDKLSLPISKTTRHGLITLALPRSFFGIDLIVCMDVAIPVLISKILYFIDPRFQTEICILLPRPGNFIIQDSSC